jgi:cytochrome c oxidase subunit 2
VGCPDGPSHDRGFAAILHSLRMQLMWRQWIPFWEPGNSAHASDVDLLFAGLMAVSMFVLTLLFFLLFTFAIHYRAGSNADRDHRIKKSWHWEIGWTAVTLAGFIALFVWGTHLYFDPYADGGDGLPIYVVAKQWMWKVQHQGGQREINELHIPVAQPIRLIMASQDVIHSFFMPAFRIKRDVVPGRYESLSFAAERTGVYRLFCAEFCGTDHSRMGGQIVVLTKAEFENWLAQQDVAGSLASEGGNVFRQLGCSGCHTPGSAVRAPPLEGLYGRPVPLQNGEVVVADDKYIRDSILLPSSQVTAGYEPVMPSFSGKVSEEDLIKLIAYIKSLANVETAR